MHALHLWGRHVSIWRRDGHTQDNPITRTNVSSVRSCKTHRDKFQLDSPLCCSFTLVQISFPLLLQRCAYALVQVEAHKHLVILRKTSGLLCGWKCPKVSFKSYSCVGTNMAGEGPTSSRRGGPQLLLNIIAVSGLLIVTQTLTAVAHLAVWLYVTPPALLHPPLHKSSSNLHERDDVSGGR